MGVTITAKGAGYPNATDTVFETSTVAVGSISNVKAPKVSASSSGKLTATAGTWNVSSPALTYNWEVVNTSNGSTLYTQNGFGNTYTPPAGTTGDFIRLTVTATKPAYLAASTIVVARAGTAIHSTTTLTVTGSKHVGDVATAGSGNWSSPSPTVTYQWLRGASKIGGATSQTYALTLSDFGKVISVTETVSKFGYKTASYKVPYATGLSPYPIGVTTQLPTITGAHTIDSTLTAHPGTWNISGLKFSYEWIRGSQSIPGATGSTYKLTPADLGTQIEIFVTASRTNYADGFETSNPLTVDVGAPLSLSKLTLPSTAAIGTKLTPSLGSWNYPATALYDWQYEPSGGSAWVDIDGASSNTYTPTAADGIAAGGKIQLIIVASRPGHPTTGITSTAVTLH